MAPEPPGLHEEHVGGEMGQELSSPVHLQGLGLLLHVLPGYVWQLSEKQMFLSPPLFSSPCLPFCAAGQVVAMLCSRLRANAAW